MIRIRRFLSRGIWARVMKVELLEWEDYEDYMNAHQRILTAEEVLNN